jgi:predicted enzyme related to lactoylglutathione lyase
MPMTTSARIDYVELSVGDGLRSRAFYESAFGWTFQNWGPEYLALHDSVREAGGLRVEVERKAPLVIVYADDLEAVRAQVVRAGGKILGPDHEFPGGRRFHFVDPDGNELAVWTKVTA